MKPFAALLAIPLALTLTSASPSEPFEGKSGRKLLEAIGRQAAPRCVVADVQQWMLVSLAGPDGAMYLPFDGQWVDVSRGWPDNVVPVAVVPQAWWCYVDAPDWLSTDLVNYLPGSGEVKKYKELYPPFEITSAQWTNGLTAVGTLSVSGIEVNAWQPPADMRGDVARILMYMLAVYGTDRLDPWAFLVADDSGMTPAGAAMMLRWSREDPVDDAERTRNAAAAAAQGGMGNPVVSLPGIEEYVWGDKAGYPYLVDPDPGVDPPTPERKPLRGVYMISEPRIDLWSPHVPDDAVWTVDGRPAGSYIVPAQIGVGSHELAFADSHGGKGRVIITIRQ